mgnify:CR=1 FL=1
MEVILLQDVKALGKKGQKVNVSEGYARNFILPKKLGIEVNAKNMNDLKLQKAHEDKVAAEQLAAAKVLAEELKNKSVELKMKVGEGGRTGLTAVTVAVLFLISLFFSPIFLAIPAFATAPALIIVGFLMFTSVATTEFGDLTEAIPAYITIIAMPFFYSISEGISMGVISYVILNLMTGKAKEKKISALMYVLTVLFILKYVFL